MEQLKRENVGLKETNKEAVQTWVDEKQMIRKIYYS